MTNFEKINKIAIENDLPFAFIEREEVHILAKDKYENVESIKRNKQKEDFNSDLIYIPKAPQHKWDF